MADGRHRYYILKDEILVDPETRNYVAMSDIDVATDINTNITAAADRASISNTELYEAVEDADKALLDAAQLANLRELYGIDNINIAPGSKARAFLLSIFPTPAADDTRANITALVAQSEARWKVIGLPGPCKEGWVNDVRRNNP